MEENIPQPVDPSSKSTAIVIAAIVIVVVVSSILAISKMSNQSEEKKSAQPNTQDLNQNQEQNPINQQMPALEEGQSGNVNEAIVNPEQPSKTTQEVKTFTVIAKNFSFSLPEIRVNNGDIVKIILDNQEGFHDILIDEFNVKSAQLKANQQTEVTFTADKTGTFEYYCSVGQHRAMGMKGNLIVE
ncbi:MAG: cupredoxin domain-containing protein [Patescibacteria group bacterium]|jgi:plastocyanin